MTGPPDELTAKELLAQQNALLAEILHTLQPDAGDNDNDDQTVTCDVCQKEMPASEMEEHGKGCFGWHTTMGTDALTDKYDTTVDD